MFQRDMNKNILIILLLITFTIPSVKAWSRPTMAISGFGGGNFQLTNTFPDLNTGAGGGVAFEYRFNQHWGLQTSLSVFSHDGEGVSQGDNGILLLSIPNIDLKFYFRKAEHNFDPYASAGIGIDVLTGGSQGDNSGGAGLGAQVGVGSDFYLMPWLSLGIATQFRTVGLIRGQNQSSALIFLTALGNFTFHFR
jgi:hypothetical protein